MGTTKDIYKAVSKAQAIGRLMKCADKEGGREGGRRWRSTYSLSRVAEVVHDPPGWTQLCTLQVSSLFPAVSAPSTLKV